MKKIKLSEPSQKKFVKPIKKQKRKYIQEKFEDGEKSLKVKKKENSIKTSSSISSSYRVLNVEKNQTKFQRLSQMKSSKDCVIQHVDDKKRNSTETMVNITEIESSNNKINAGKYLDFKHNINPCEISIPLNKKRCSKKVPKKIKPYKTSRQFVVESSSTKMLKFNNCENKSQSSNVQTTNIEADSSKLYDESQNTNKNNVLFENMPELSTNSVLTKNKEAEPKERKTSVKKYYDGLEYLDYDSDALVIDLSSEE